MGRFEFIQDLVHTDSVFHSHTSCVNVFILSMEEVIEVAGNPAVLAPDQVYWLHDGLLCSGLGCVRSLGTNTINGT
jgi:hypothetical protein